MLSPLRPEADKLPKAIRAYRQVPRAMRGPGFWMNYFNQSAKITVGPDLFNKALKQSSIIIRHAAPVT